MIYHRNNDPANDSDPHDLEDYADAVKQTVKSLRPRKDEFDFIAVTGMSGVLVGGPVSLILDKPLVVRRKPGDDAHSSQHINATAAEGRGLFLDDFVVMGETRQEVKRCIEALGAKLTCQYVYKYDEWSTL